MQYEANGSDESTPQEASPRFGRRAIGVVAVASLLFVGATGVYAAIGPRFAAAREEANRRTCFANQKTLAGAVEMFSLDKCTKITDLAPVLPLLKEGGYLQTLPDDPGQGPGTATHFSLTTEGNGVTCSVHGSIPPGPGPR